MEMTRRGFFGAAVAAGAVSLVGGCRTTGGAAADKSQPGFKFGMAGFTMCRKSLPELLDILKKTDIHYLCVKDFHLPLTATDAEIAAFRETCAKAGVEPYAVGPIYMKDAVLARRAFEYAKRLGVKTVVGVPYEPTDEKDSWNKRKGSRKLLLVIDKLVKEFDIRYAIHNHGPASPDMFPSVASGWELIHDLDPRIGFCMDVGWEYGCGVDPVETIRQHSDRIYDMHIKNFEVGKPDGAAIPLPRGKIDYVRVIRALMEVGYSNVCSLEYEKDFEDNLEPVAESVGYWRGIVDALSR